MVIGFSIAAPVGPIGILCIRRTLAEGRASGLATGLGAATADALYGFVAAFGLTAISGLLMVQLFWLRLLGGAFLGYLGVKTFFAKLPRQTLPDPGRGLFSAYASALFLTLTNPMTVLFFAAVFAGIGRGGGRSNYFSAGAFVLGVFAGSGLWWFILSGGVGILWKRFNPSGLQWVNRIADILIAAFGVMALLS